MQESCKHDHPGDNLIGSCGEMEGGRLISDDMLAQFRIQFPFDQYLLQKPHSELLKEQYADVKGTGTPEEVEIVLVAKRDQVFGVRGFRHEGEALKCLQDGKRVERHLVVIFESE